MEHHFTTAKQVQEAITTLYGFHKVMKENYADSRIMQMSSDKLDELADDLERFDFVCPRPWRDDVNRPNRFAALFMPDGRILVRTVQNSDVTDIQKLYMSSPEAADAYLILENVVTREDMITAEDGTTWSEYQAKTKVLKNRYSAVTPIEGVINGG